MPPSEVADGPSGRGLMLPAEAGSEEERWREP